MGSQVEAGDDGQEGCRKSQKRGHTKKGQTRGRLEDGRNARLEETIDREENGRSQKCEKEEERTKKEAHLQTLKLNGNTDLLCQNQVNIAAKPNLLWNFRFPRHLHPQFQQQIRILHNLIKKFLSIHHNRKIKPNRQKLGHICPMKLQQKTRQTPLGEAYYAKLKAKSILMNKKKKKLC